MNGKLTPTLALIVAGGLAAGVALARPASSNPTQPTSAPSGTSTGEFLGEDADPNRGFLATTTTETPIERAEITVVDFGFGAPITVDPGELVAVTNRDGAPHTVTADSGAFTTDSIVGGGEGAFEAPSTPGTFQFFCAIHPSMQGELIVRG